MSSEMLAAIVGAMVGGFLAALGSWIIFQAQDKGNDRKRRQLFATAVIDDLEASGQLFDNLKLNWDTKRSVWFEYTIELKERRTIYKRYSEYLLLFSDELREDLFKYYLKTDILIHLLEAFENRKIVLSDQYNANLKILKKENPSLDNQNANNIVISNMSDEDQEYKNLEIAIGNLLTELLNHKRQTTNLINKLRKLK